MWHCFDPNNCLRQTKIRKQVVVELPVVKKIAKNKDPQKSRRMIEYHVQCELSFKINGTLGRRSHHSHVQGIFCSFHVHKISMQRVTYLTIWIYLYHMDRSNSTSLQWFFCKFQKKRSTQSSWQVDFGSHLDPTWAKIHRKNVPTTPKNIRKSIVTM